MTINNLSEILFVFFLGVLILYRHFFGPYLLYKIFYGNPSRWQKYKIQTKSPPANRVEFDRKMTQKSIFLDFIVIFFCYFLKKNELLKLSMNFDFQFIHWLYSLFVFNLLFFLQDFYFYFTHKLFHQGILFKYIHSVHHHSTNPTPWTSFSLHPVEFLVESLFYPIVLCLIPINYPTLLIYVFVTTTINFLGHCGFEIPILSLSRLKYFRWAASFTFHNRHHQYFKGNYSLYFNIWDRIFKTNIP